MKTRLWILAVAVVMYAASAFAATPVASNKYQHISNTWNAPNSTYPDCTSIGSVACLDTYTFMAAPPAGTGGATSIITVPNGGIAAGGVVSYLYGPGGYLYCGTWTVSVVANYRDDAGASVQSSADSATVVVPCPLTASPATNLVSTPAL